MAHIHAKLVIVRFGPKAYTAATYAACIMLEPVLISSFHLMITTEIKNYPSGIVTGTPDGSDRYAVG